MDSQVDLERFGLGSVVRVVGALRELSRDATSVEVFAHRVCQFLHAHILDPEGAPQTALVRFYATTPLGALPADDRRFVASGTSGIELSEATTCLALLGTAGEVPEWNDRVASKAHRVIPLIDALHVGELPMIAALLGQLRVDIEALVDPERGVLLPLKDDSYSIFFVPEAMGSPVVPAQDFVADHGVVSVLGFGGTIPSGEVYAVVLFTKVAIAVETAQLWSSVALSTNLAALDMLELPLFAAAEVRDRSQFGHLSVAEAGRAREDALRRLVALLEDVAASESDKADRALSRANLDARKAAALANVALGLSAADSVSEVTRVIVTEGILAIGADGGGIAVIDDSGRRVRLQISENFGADAADTYGELALDDSLPAVAAALHGQMVLIGTRTEGLERFPQLASVYETLDVEAVASLPLVVAGRVVGSVSFAWSTCQEFDDDRIQVMEALAAQVAQALDRTRLRELERRRAEILQLSLLTEPPSSVHFEIAVRYLAAGQHAQVGGDWYDAFMLRDGSMIVSVGDVVGHDTSASGAMGQLRNMLRTIAFTHECAPAGLVGLFDDTVCGLGVGAFASAVVAKLAEGTSGGYVARICNAGHPPPLMLSDQGTVEVLGHQPEPMIGIQAGISRSDFEVMLRPGSSVLLYTDGLVERRGEGISTGIAKLAEAFAAVGQLPVQGQADAIVRQMLAGEPEDDVALLVVRVGAKKP